jgi:hypothetical protein
MTREEFTSRWQERADEWGRMGVLAEASRLITQLLSELSSVFSDEENELLSVAEAAKRSGYSPDHVARLVRKGTIPNAGRRGKPMVRAGDLSRRTHTIAGPKGSAYDPVTDARALRSRR